LINDADKRVARVNNVSNLARLKIFWMPDSFILDRLAHKSPIMLILALFYFGSIKPFLGHPSSASFIDRFQWL
jgi:hypothetical protein